MVERRRGGCKAVLRVDAALVLSLGRATVHAANAGRAAVRRRALAGANMFERSSAGGASESTADVVRQAELAAGSNDIAGCLQTLRRLSLDDFATLIFGLPDSRHPALSEMLPSMPAEEVQRGFTGAAGRDSLVQTLPFVRMVAQAFEKLTGRPLAGRRILDYGCGYGRMLRLMTWFSDPSSLYGFDPMEEALEICRANRLPGHLHRIEYLPESLPCAPLDFDLVYCFSVFTHTSPRATRCALEALRARVAADGVVAITIRPVGFWRETARAGLVPEAKVYEQAHGRDGFAFYPHNRAAVDGDVTYGDTSMTLDYLRSNFPFFRVAMHDENYIDPYQTVVYLTPA
jgi:SAM-dependent methyltransferase